ncbi:MAG: hypothetical protein JST61_06950 [Acidobacteria bacterium]|nr:hypothetical protein [Acidobacteriota bacterium]
MDHRLATREDAIAIARDMQEKLPVLAKRYPQTPKGRKEWTKAVWQYFEDFRKTKEPQWTLWPQELPKSGKVKGEYLTDFSLCDEYIGYRIACESEWGGFDRIKWAFDKLRAVKADLKILIFEEPHTKDDALPKRIEEEFSSSLAMSGHHHPGHEVYLFIQFDQDKSKLFFWEPTTSGPSSQKDIRFERIK